MLSALQSVLLEIVPLIVGSLSVIAAAFGIGDAATALRAKQRLRAKVGATLPHDAALREYAMKPQLDDVDIAQLHARLARLADELSEADRRRVRVSLDQPSKAGERRYIREMLTA